MKKIIIMLCVVFLMLIGSLIMLDNQTQNEKRIEELNKPQISNIIKYSNQDSIESLYINCLNNDINDFTKCVVANVRKIYKYRITDDNEYISFSEMKLLGGDCLNWAELYAEIGKRHGYWVSYGEMKSGEAKAHIFTIISNTQGYCNIDGINYKCYKFS